MRKVLVIDDDPTGTQLLLTLLGLEGYQGFELKDWTDPVRDVERLRPDLVIMDVRLSVTDGYQVLETIRAHPEPEVAGVPVLMMSAEDVREQSRSAGADGFVEKPFELTILLAAIQQAMEGRLSGS
jgi:CheY-like chemotaxis protein